MTPDLDDLSDDGTMTPTTSDEVLSGEAQALAIEHIVGLGPRVHTMHEAADLLGLEPEQLDLWWRALGYPEPPENEPYLSDEDVATFAAAVELTRTGVIDMAALRQVSRVLGGSLARIADAEVRSFRAAMRTGKFADLLGLDPSSDVEPTPETFARLGQAIADIAPLLERTMVQVWRRHLATAAQRDTFVLSGSHPVDVVVGFADLVGYTAMSQRLRTDELAEVVTAFEASAIDTVVRHGGRVIKMIGDEVMYEAPTVTAGCQIAWALIDECEANPLLPPLRCGLAVGHALAMDGDLFGPPVNVASRLTSVANPNSLLMPAEDALEADGIAVVEGAARVPPGVSEPRQFVGKPLRERIRLKGIGPVRVVAIKRRFQPAE